jgi:hypothetical protein
MITTAAREKIKATKTRGLKKADWWEVGFFFIVELHWSAGIFAVNDQQIKIYLRAAGGNRMPGNL